MTLLVVYQMISVIIRRKHLLNQSMHIINHFTSLLLFIDFILDCTRTNKTTHPEARLGKKIQENNTELLNEIIQLQKTTRARQAAQDRMVTLQAIIQEGNQAFLGTDFLLRPSGMAGQEVRREKVEGRAKKGERPSGWMREDGREKYARNMMAVVMWGIEPVPTRDPLGIPLGITQEGEGGPTPEGTQRDFTPHTHRQTVLTQLTSVIIRIKTNLESGFILRFSQCFLIVK